MKLGLPKIAHLATAGLGLIVFFLGFADVFDGSDDSYFSGGSVVPALFLLGGLFALPAILPGDNKPGIAPAAFSVAAMLTVLFFTFSTDPDLGIGTILLLIFGILQGIVSVAAYLLDAGVIKMPAPNPYGHQPPGGMYPPSGQFQQQPGAFPPPPQQPQAPPGQATTFAPQQGQFGQPGQPGQAPGTPPGGYPQQG